MRVLVLALLAGCTMRNPAFDEPTDGVAASSSSTATASDPTVPTGPGTSTDAAATTQPTDPTTADPTTSTTSTTTSDDTTTDPLTSTSAPTTATTATTATTDICPDACPACHACQGGACVPTPGAACDAPIGEPCETLIAEYADEGDELACYAYAPSPAQCDALGECVWACAGRVELTRCGAGCVKPDHPCTPGNKTNTVNVGSPGTELEFAL